MVLAIALSACGASTPEPESADDVQAEGAEAESSGEEGVVGSGEEGAIGSGEAVEATDADEPEVDPNTTEEVIETSEPL